MALAVDESLDTDADGLADLLEITVHHTDPTRPDTDGDGYADGLEVANGYSPLHGESRRMVDVDTDRDYLNDDWEVKAGTDLTDPDSDGDLYLDGTEVAAAYDPLDPNPVRVSKRIDVDLKTQTLSYYLDEKLVESFPISSGLPGTPSPVGNFSVLDKVPVKHYGGPGFDFPNTKWNLLFHRSGSGTGYYVHGAYWHDNWGHPMSHGCINVPYERMERLYWWAQHGTPVVIR
ncbi:L,D-transpeptidase [Candidatus Uhrbacteria bacterium]|nr:L,D-transpeptidase [Candidatus Uhrbacteria bacterium]